MTLPVWVKPLGFVLLLGLCLWFMLYAKTCTAQKKLAKDTALAAALASEGKADQAAEALHAQQVSCFQAQQAKDDAQSTALAARVAEAKRRLAQQSAPQLPAPAAPSALPQVPTAKPLETPLDLAAVVARQKELIGALEAQHDNDVVRLKDRDDVISAQSLELASAHAAEKAFQAQAIQEHAARVAAEGAAQSSRWMGRIEGVAVGFGGGFILGKVVK